MNVRIIKVGYLQTNCYILVRNRSAIVIDPGDEYEKIVSELKDLDLIAILITHHHFDHVGAIEYFKNVVVYDYNNLDEKEYQLGDFSFEVLYTKGHTDDSVSFYFKKEKIMFTGDFVFENSIGRTDLETGNDYLMHESIEKLKRYPSDIKLYPGHGNVTFLSKELENNPFF